MTRKLDALVAERVMEITVQGPGWRYPSEDHLPHYSTDIAAAWEVVEKLRTKGDPFAVMSPSEYGEYSCYFDSRHPAGAGDTAPLAIVIAALKAKGVDEKTIEEALASSLPS